MYKIKGFDFSVFGFIDYQEKYVNWALQPPCYISWICTGIRTVVYEPCRQIVVWST
jgi:hypothetical protein